MAQERYIRGGLIVLPRDQRDFQLGRIITLPKLNELPLDFELDTLGVKDQGVTDYCSAYTSCLISELQEGVELLPDWSFAASKSISGYPERFGQDMRSAMMAHVKFGAIEKQESVEIPEDPRVFINWPEYLREKATIHRKQSVVSITGPYDYFDNIRASMWYFRNEKRAISLGILWNYPLDQIFISEPQDNGTGHMVTIKGWRTVGDQPFLVIQNSYGEIAGETGRHYISRSVVNKFAPMFGAMMFVDMPPGDYKKYHWSFWERAYHFFKKIFT